MKKIVSSMIICITMLATTVFSYAALNVKETPNVKIVIDGEVSTFEDVPIIQNGRTLLPLRAILTKLGVTNDDKHILWNGQENSVIVNKDAAKIKLNVNSNIAYVNDSPVTLDAAPVNYKSRVYIPTRFISQSLGKKVIWDGVTSSVLIKDEKDFDDIKEILSDSIEATKGISKLKSKVKGSLVTSNNGSQGTFINESEEIDKSKKLIHYLSYLTIDGKECKSESYQTSNMSYVKSYDLTGKWENNYKTKTEIEECFDIVKGILIFKNDDVLDAGLAADRSNKDEIVLKGNVYLDGTFCYLSPRLAALTGINFNKQYVEVHIDKNTNLVREIDAEITTTEEPNPLSDSWGNVSISKISFIYSDFNGDFDIQLPQELSIK